VVDRAGLPQPHRAVVQDADGALGQAEIHAPAVPLAAQQSAGGHPGQGGAGRLLGDAGPRKNLDNTARVDADALVEDVVTEERQHDRRGCRWWWHVAHSTGGVGGMCSDVGQIIDQRENHA
jgi:hypothetical protein